MAKLWVLTCVCMLVVSATALAQQSSPSSPPVNGSDQQVSDQQVKTTAPATDAAAQNSSTSSVQGAAETSGTQTSGNQIPNTQPQQQSVPAPSVAGQPKMPVDGTFDEVHITPRVDPNKKPNVPDLAADEGDPTLRTHTKPMRVDVDLVLVPVTITDPMNRLVTGLERENFVLIDNGDKQEIKHFSSEDAPISLGVIFDMSGSMKDKLDKAKEAVVEFFKTANPEDEFFMVAFNDRPEMISDFTNSIEEIQGQLVYALPKGQTALMDSIYMGLAKMKKAKNQKKALLIISDGGDNRSRYTENEIKSLVKEADVQIYAIGIFSPNPATPEEQTGPMTLASITDVTGGRTFTIDNPNELPDIATKIGIELRNQYVLGYRPNKPARDGKWRKIRVKLNAPKGLPPLSVYSRTGYYAPSE